MPDSRRGRFRADHWPTALIRRNIHFQPNKATTWLFASRLPLRRVASRRVAIVALRPPHGISARLSSLCRRRVGCPRPSRGWTDAALRRHGASWNPHVRLEWDGAAASPDAMPCSRTPTGPETGGDEGLIGCERATTSTQFFSRPWTLTLVWWTRLEARVSSGDPRLDSTPTRGHPDAKGAANAPGTRRWIHCGASSPEPTSRSNGCGILGLRSVGGH